jgi:hypothetical protein
MLYYELGIYLNLSGWAIRDGVSWYYKGMGITW